MKLVLDSWSSEDSAPKRKGAGLGMQILTPTSGAEVVATRQRRDLTKTEVFLPARRAALLRTLWKFKWLSGRFAVERNLNALCNVRGAQEKSPRKSYAHPACRASDAGASQKQIGHVMLSGVAAVGGSDLS